MGNLTQITQQYKADTESVYNTWFVDNDQRLKAFRTIRRDVLQVIADIKNKDFPNDFRTYPNRKQKSKSKRNNCL